MNLIKVRKYFCFCLFIIYLVDLLWCEGLNYGIVTGTLIEMSLNRREYR